MGSRSDVTSQSLLPSLASLRASSLRAIKSMTRHLTTRFQPILLIIRSIMRDHDWTSCFFRATFEPSRTGDCSIILKRFHTCPTIEQSCSPRRSLLLAFRFYLRQEMGTVRFAFPTARQHLINQNSLWIDCQCCCHYHPRFLSR